MDHLQNHVKDVGSGPEVITPFWAVPKVNFPKGLPHDVAQFLVDEETLENMQLRSGGTIDRETYFIVDQEVQRQGLGRNVGSLELYVATSTRARLPPAEALGTAHGDDARGTGTGTAHGGGARQTAEPVPTGAVTVHGDGTRTEARRKGSLKRRKGAGGAGGGSRRARAPRRGEGG